MENKPITFRSSGLSGDLIAFMAGIKKVCEDADTKAIIYMWLDRPMYLYPGAEHPYGSVMFNRYAFDMMKPLIEAQDYVQEFLVWSGQQFTIDLDIHRERQIGMPYGSLHRWMGLMYPDMQTDLSESWLEAGTTAKAKVKELRETILINRTSRYQNHTVSYFFLNEYKDRVMFVGLEKEHADFCNQWDLEIKRLHVKNFLGLATAIDNCKFFIGNQSMCYGIAEALKVPRLMEYCTFAPNVIPVGKHAYDYASQSALQWLVEKLDREL